MELTVDYIDSLVGLQPELRAVLRAIVEKLQEPAETKE